MPEDKAAVYQTRVQAGEFLVMAEVPADRVEAIQSLMQTTGGEELHVNDSPLPRSTAGRISNVDQLAPEVRSHLSLAAQQVYIDRYNTAFDETLDDGKAERAAWDTIHQQFDEDENGMWSKQRVTA
ncbi:ChaB family protein [Leptolyngbya ohadii]|uniref:ChaB family protein n=1 Tax=Leptolyngbya ohadii TaxID=1962290 RepID=UPI0021F0ECCA|nr:ChaB family protein [Leptolyngbya ohadii]